MKRIICMFMVFTTLFLCASCSSKEEEEVINIQPQTSQMRAICELSTMKCYYHNVAKYHLNDGEGHLFWKKDIRFWVEYSGVVTLGIDASLLEMEIIGDEVKITIPKAKVQGCKVDEKTLTKDSFIVDKDSGKVTAEHQTQAFKEAQKKMEESAQKDKVLLENAQMRAKDLLENYVKGIGDLMGRNYTVIFIDAVEETPKQTTTKASA